MSLFSIHCPLDISVQSSVVFCLKITFLCSWVCGPTLLHVPTVHLPSPTIFTGESCDSGEGERWDEEVAGRLPARPGVRAVLRGRRDAGQHHHHGCQLLLRPVSSADRLIPIGRSAVVNGPPSDVQERAQLPLLARCEWHVLAGGWV